MLNKHLKCFVCVADMLSFTKAAQHLFLTPSAVTLQIKALEEYLGFSLFDRDNRGVALTPAGAAFYQEARQILQLSDQAIHAARTVAGVKRNAIRIGVWGSDCHRILPLVCSAFSSQHPDIELQFVNFTSTHNLSSSLQDGTVDLLVRYGISAHQEKGVRYRTLFYDPIVCQLPAHHPLAENERITTAQLSGHIWVMPTENASPFHAQIHEAITAKHPDIRSHRTAFYQSSLMELQMLPGFMLCPRSLSEEGSRYVCRPFEMPLKVSIDLITSDRSDPVIDEFYAIAKRICTDQLAGD